MQERQWTYSWESSSKDKEHTRDHCALCICLYNLVIWSLRELYIEKKKAERIYYPTVETSLALSGIFSLTRTYADMWAEAVRNQFNGSDFRWSDHLCTYTDSILIGLMPHVRPCSSLSKLPFCLGFVFFLLLLSWPSISREIIKQEKKQQLGSAATDGIYIWCQWVYGFPEPGPPQAEKMPHTKFLQSKDRSCLLVLENIFRRNMTFHVRLWLVTLSSLYH